MSTQPIDLSTPTTKVLAIGQFTEKALDPAKRLPVMMHEVPATLRLHLAGKIEQWFIKPDLSGPVFIMDSPGIEDAREILSKLPLGIEGMMRFDLIPLGPLTPLRLLLND
ncbi:hypothetical protein BEL04_19450 [Mucilaginibacter sp. PPCGB 2223]|uniref:hypothetical protein n=1 Tax=Mucilaginibacter sp. PPCGB 2223 TaxID=1886027 RepID=UPI000825E43D|nr:hypothetical protein [Mucilaginibacter sp. PPCGB 2223]OCX50901.1 hypothetical protein BEL04_19450 [Mucilaginibacter sp. PPCGB 2223]